MCSSVAMAVSTPTGSSKGAQFARFNTCWRDSCTSKRRGCGGSEIISFYLRAQQSSTAAFGRFCTDLLIRRAVQDAIVFPLYDPIETNILLMVPRRTLSLVFSGC